jgi:high-affinity Fe2+/Pb2+ permease
MVYTTSQAAAVQLSALIINMLLLALIIAGLVMFVIVLFKLNKALNIWLKQHQNPKKGAVNKDEDIVG